MTSRHQKITLLGICGGSASGKSLLSQKIQEELGEKLAVVSQDNYYKDLSHWPQERREAFNFDHPDAFDNDLFVSDLDRLKLGQEIRVPGYDYASCCRLPHQPPLTPGRVVIIEGLFILSVESIRNRLDHTCFVQASESTRVDRRFKRDTQERGKSQQLVTDTLQNFVLPMHNQFIEPSKAETDRVVENETNDSEHLKKAAKAIIQALNLA